MPHPSFAHLLSPYTVGKLTFRNRIMTAPTGIHALQAGEPFPTESLIATFANRARGGAGVVCIPSYFEKDNDFSIAWDMSVANHRHYLAAAAEAVRFHGAVASMEVSAHASPLVLASAGIPGPDGTSSREMSLDEIERMTDEFAENCYIGKYAGFQMCHLHMAYGSPVGGSFLSFATNQRTDRFGGSIENMANFPLLAADKIKARCGQNFLVELRISGEEPQYENGMRPEHWIEMSKYLEGHVDLLMVHAPKKEYAHPSEFYPDMPYVSVAERIKKGGCKIPVVAIGAIQDPIDAERILADGKADLIAMARGVIADPDMPRKAYEGRIDEIVPCIRCVRCHDSACRDNKTYVCSVNPRIGMEHKILHYETVPERFKKIAVVGGGPAGMEAALELSHRGHEVTLFEKRDCLGGLLNEASYPEFKSALRRFMSYMIHSIDRSSVDVRLSTEATPDLIRSGGYDELIAAIGAQPVTPPISGIDGDNVWLGVSVFGNENKLGKRTVIIGGGQIGCEIALHLARFGIQVTILEATNELAANATVLYRADLIEALGKEKNILSICGAFCKSIGKEVVFCLDGKQRCILADSVILATGMRARTEEAYELYVGVRRISLVGSCLEDGNVEQAMRTAFGIACSV